MNVNAAAATKTKGILRGGKGQRKELPKSSEMPAGSVAKMMASKQDVVVDGKKVKPKDGSPILQG